MNGGWERITGRELGIYRVMFAGALLLTLPSFTWAAAYPDDLYASPPGPMRLFGGFPPAWVLFAVGAGVAVAAACLLFGVAAGIMSWAATLLLMYGYGVHNSLGKIDHSILLVLTPAVMALAGWAPGGRVRPWVMQLWAFTIGVGMLTAAIPKFVAGWLDPSTRAVRGVLAQHVLAYHQHALGSDLGLSMTSPWLWEPVDWVAPMLEASVIVAAVLGLRAFRAVLALLVPFHLVIGLTLDIAFTSNVLAYGAFVRWSKVPGAGGLADWISSKTRWWVAPTAAGAVAFSYMGIHLGLPILLIGVLVAMHQVRASMGGRTIVEQAKAEVPQRG